MVPTHATYIRFGFCETCKNEVKRGRPSLCKNWAVREANNVCLEKVHESRTLYAKHESRTLYAKLMNVEHYT